MISSQSSYTWRQRFLIISCLVWTMFGVYLFINSHPSATATEVSMPPWISLKPSWLPVYFALLFVTWLLPVAIAHPVRFRACLIANVCAWILVMPWWIITPTKLSRPPLPEGFWSYPIKMLWASDQPYNILPCSHGVGPIIAAWFAGKEYLKWRWLIMGLVCLALPSIPFVYQHRPVDVLLGTVAAIVGILVGEKSSRSEL